MLKTCSIAAAALLMPAVALQAQTAQDEGSSTSEHHHLAWYLGAGALGASSFLAMASHGNDAPAAKASNSLAPQNEVSHGGSQDGIHQEPDSKTSSEGSVNSLADVTTTSTVPEPGSLALVATGMMGLAGVVRRKSRGA